MSDQFFLERVRYLSVNGAARSSYLMRDHAAFQRRDGNLVGKRVGKTVPRSRTLFLFGGAALYGGYAAIQRSESLVQERLREYHEDEDSALSSTAAFISSIDFNVNLCAICGKCAEILLKSYPQLHSQDINKMSGRTSKILVKSCIRTLHE